MEFGFVLMTNQYKTYDATSSQNRTHCTMGLRNRTPMDQKDRLKLAMHDAGYTTPTEAWTAKQRVLGISKDLVISNANGHRPISKKAAEAYANAFGRSAGWYLFGEDGEAPDIRKVPLVSPVSASRLKRREGVTPAEIERYVHVDNLESGDWIALTVDGDSMNRVALDGAIIIVNRADDGLVDGKFYVFRTEEGETTFKMFKASPMRLQPFSTNLDHMSIPVLDDGNLYVFGRVRRVIQDV